MSAFERFPQSKGFPLFFTFFMHFLHSFLPSFVPHSKRKHLAQKSQKKNYEYDQPHFSWLTDAMKLCILTKQFNSALTGSVFVRKPDSFSHSSAPDAKFTFISSIEGSQRGFQSEREVQKTYIYRKQASGSGNCIRTLGTKRFILEGKQTMWRGWCSMC